MESIIGCTRRPDITFYSDGRIDITARIARQLSLSEGDSIDVGKACSEYFLYVRRRFDPSVSFGFEATVRTTKRRSHNFRAYSVRMCRAVLSLYDAKQKVSPQLGQPINDADYGVIIPLIHINLANNKSQAI